jgi:hypothetical protein
LVPWNAPMLAMQYTGTAVRRQIIPLLIIEFGIRLSAGSIKGGICREPRFLKRERAIFHIGS